MMLVPLQNVRSLRPLIDALDQLASPRVVERGLLSAGLSRRVIEGPPIFIPSLLQAAFVENVARQLGERHLGTLLGSQFSYEDLDIYAQYVLDAPRLDIAFSRGVRALPFLQSGASVNLRDAGECIVLQFGSGIHSVVGSRHIDEGVPFLLIDLARHFLGFNWHPKWVELPEAPHPGNATLDNIYKVPIRYGHQIPGIAILKGELQTLNPRPRMARNVTLFGDLRAMVRQRPPSTMAGAVRETLELMAMVGEPFEESVAARLGVGKRKLQRQLASEGCTFREILASFRVERAKALLQETDLSVQEIAASLGYLEVNSFRRAFQKCVGLTPTEFCVGKANGNWV